MRTKNEIRNDTDDLRPEYDLSKLKGGMRGKYFKRATAGTVLVLLEPDVAEAFPDANAVNQALRVLARLAQTQARAVRHTHEPSDTYEDSPRQETKVSSALKKRILGKSANKKKR
jgi:hypothetical protein